MSDILDVDRVRHRFGAVTALDEVHLKVGAGECVALLGPNGAGKTTLIGLATGLLAVQSGRVQVCGGDPRLAATRRHLGVVQQSMGFPRTLTVGELVRGWAVRSGRSAAAAGPVLAEVGITELRERRAVKLSGGQQRRLALVVAVFVPLYARATFTPGPLRRWAPALSTALGLLVTPVNSGATVLLVYAAGFAGAHQPRRWALRWMAGLTVLLGVLAAVSPIPFPYRIWAFAPAAVFVWIIGLTCLAEAERERESTELRVDNARIQHLATLSERDRISRDLHDLLGQALTGIVVRSQLAQRLTPGAPDAGVAEMAEVERAARAALAEVRATVQGWRQVMLDDELAVAREALAAAGVELVAVRDPEVVLSPSAETALSLALREAVTNVVRHAHARRCTVRLGRRDGEVVLEIVDDGVGGDPREGNGLIGMRERIAALGGNMTRGVRDGTAITVTVPAAVAT